jgi:hypothetical protein
MRRKEEEAMNGTQPAGNRRDGRKVVHKGREAIERFGHQAAIELRRDVTSPQAAAAVAGAAVLGAALLFGVAETIVGAAAGLVVYRILRRRGAEQASTAPSP